PGWRTKNARICTSHRACCSDWSAAENDKAMGGNGDVRRNRHAVPGRPIGEDAAAVSGSVWVRHLIVKITVEDLTPLTGTGKANPVPETVEFLQVEHEQDVFAQTFDPTMDGHDTSEAVGGRDAQLLAAQGGMRPAQANQGFGEFDIVQHRSVNRQPGPIDEQVGKKLHGVIPMLVL